MSDPVAAARVASEAPLAASPLAGLRRVRVGTRNGPKIEAVRRALGAYAVKLEVQGAAVESGVPEQPVGHAEIVRGARNRARAAHADGPCDLAVGIEDGLVELGLDAGEALVVNVGCAALFDGERESLGFSAGFAYPPAVSERALQLQEPIGDLFDALWHRSRAGARVAGESVEPAASSHTVGNIGKLTLGVLPRSEYARHAVVCAAVRFLHPDLYPSDYPSEPASARTPEETRP